MALSRSRVIPTRCFVKALIDKFTDELYALASEEVGGTVIVKHLCDYTIDQKSAEEIFTSPPMDSNQAYELGILERSFKSKGLERNGAVILYLRNALVSSVSTGCTMVRHNCEQKWPNRGTRHNGAYTFSNFREMIVIVSEEKGHVSLFRKGHSQFDIAKEELKNELLNAYDTQEESYLACTTFDDQYFSKYFQPNPLIANENDNRCELISDCFIKDLRDLHKGTSFRHKGTLIYLIHENTECQVRKLQNMVFGLSRLGAGAADDETSLGRSTSGIKANPSNTSLSKRAIGNSVSMILSRSRIKTNLSNEKCCVEKFIGQLAAELYVLARKKWWRKAIGGTVIVNHLREETIDWHETMRTFISVKPFKQPYEPRVLEKIFTSKGREHDGAVILYLNEGLVHTVSAKLPLTKHDCKQCALRGTRHTSACCFSNFTPVPIIVISEETGEVSLFRKGRSQFDIAKEELKNELLNAYDTQEEFCSAYTTFNDQHFSKYFQLNPIIPNDNDDHKWFFEFSVKNLMDLYKDTSIKIGKYFIDVAPKNSEYNGMAEAWFKYGVQGDIEAYNRKEEQCLILSHGDKRLGGIFYKVVGNTLYLYQPFLLRQLIHDGFAVPFIREVLWKRMCPQCETIEFVVPQDMSQPYTSVIKALSANSDTQ